jgi:hypothetical protein
MILRPGLWYRSSLLAWCCLVLLCPAPSAWAGVHETLAGSSCWILIKDDATGWKQGTGWIVDTKKGWIITNEHVVGKHEEVTVYLSHWEGEKLVHDSAVYWQKIEPLQGRVRKIDVKRDLALVEVPEIAAGFPALKLAETGAKAGDKLYYVGNSDVTGQRVDNARLWHFGEITVDVVGYRLHPRDTGGMTEARIVQVKGGIRHGDSGGPVVNDKGELVAVISAVNLMESSVALLTDVSEVRRFVERYQTGPPKADPKDPLLGRWQVVIHIPEKEKLYAAMELLPGGKALIEGHSQAADGTYKLDKNLMSLSFPAIEMNTRGMLTWDNENRFVLKFTDAEYEYLRDQ